MYASLIPGQIDSSRSTAREALAEERHRLLDAPVVHLDARLRRLPAAGPVAPLEPLLGLGARLAKEAVVLVEAVAHRSRDVGGERNHERGPGNIAGRSPRGRRARSAP